MQKDPLVELQQLKTGITSLISYLKNGVDHLDLETCLVLARALDELMQETVNMPKSTTAEDIDTFAKEVFVGTDEVHKALAAKWYDDLQPLIERTQIRAEQLDHQLADFSCLSVDGQTWGAICIKCTRWVIIQPDQATGALINRCTGWIGATWLND